MFASQKRTMGKVRLMSALPPKADIADAVRDVRFVPKADMPLIAMFGCHGLLDLGFDRF